AGNDALVAIVNHLTREGSELPFFVGQTQEGNFYFNGLYNYTMSLVFTDLDSDAPLGVVQGQETHTGLYCALSLGEGQFAIASYSFNERFFQGQVAISESGISATVGLEGNPIPELDLNSHVEALSLSDNFLAFGADSRDRQIMLYAYSKADGGLVGTQYYGFGLPYTFGGMSTTADGGLIIAGSVYVADRFQRVALIKLAEEDVNALVLGTVVVDQE
ncbi:MAG TPA: hypothetical protein DCE41_10840, partial [Cytophagales bacterium]|nr:hypothetical protein [Cytophagales bacterium]